MSHSKANKEVISPSVRERRPGGSQGRRGRGGLGGGREGEEGGDEHKGRCMK